MTRGTKRKKKVKHKTKDGKEKGSSRAGQKENRVGGI